MVQLKGIDCATKLNDASAKGLKDVGITHVGRYLEHGWKGMTLDEVKSISNAGLMIFSIFELNPTKTSYFTHEQGVQDANTATSYAKEVNQPEGTAIYFTVDYGGGNNDLPQVEDYFKGVKETLQGYKVGVYGSFDVVSDLKSKGLIDYVFQTYAWSGGKEDKNHDIYQHLNGQTVVGINVDLDEIDNDAGSWSFESVTIPSAKSSAPSQPKKESVVKKVVKKVEEIIHHDVRYSVKPGDTLSEIANRFGVTVDDLVKWNNIRNENLIRIGQIIKVKETTHHQTNAKKTYTVKSGDSLSKIASAHKMSLAEIEKLNPQIKDFDVIQVGEKINLN